MTTQAISMHPYDYDIAIIGSGPAGLSMAAAMSAHGLRCRVIEKQPQDAIAHPKDDGREIALTWRSVDLLKKIGAWAFIDEAQLGKIRSAHVLNGDPLHALVVNAGDTSLDRLAFIVSNHLIRDSLYKTVEDDTRITQSYGVGVSHISTDQLGARITLDSGEDFRARLAIAADSRFSTIREKMGIKADRLDFKRTMIVCRVGHQVEHHNKAYEWFQDEHTLAMLPLAGQNASAVLTIPSERAKAYMGMDKESYCARISELFQHRYGPLTMAGERYAYPLVAMYAERFYAPSFILAGDAAVGMHPVTAHGFNFGLRGVESLSRLVEDALRDGADWGDEKLLRRYHRELRFATRPLYLATNMVATLYTKTDPMALLLRRTLLGAGNRIPFARRLLAEKLIDRAA